MCTNVTTSVMLRGSGKADDSDEWFDLTTATVYFDHPFDAPLDHSLNIDIPRPDGSPGARIALELDRDSASALAAAIVSALATTP